MPIRKTSLRCTVLMLATFALQPLIPARWASACTRVTYLGPDENVITARSMDWAEDPGTDLWSFPKGLKRDGAAGPGSISWTSKHGSVISSFYNIATVDGMNDAGWGCLVSFPG